ncbi:MAG: APC family permease [Thermoflexales bacterium]|nr:APC family permease [Thermoflexales bacterium]
MDKSIESFSVRRLLFGDPLATAQAVHERLSKLKALAVFSSDALSSVAYATEEILLILILAGSGAIGLAWPVALVIATLLAIVAISYYQTIHAYPSGGGSYIVSHDNLGVLPGLVAAAALLTDYVLTVAVSISAGVAAITSAVPALLPFTVPMAVLFISLVTLANLRGVRESGTIFAVPTYLFVVTFLTMIGVGLAKWLFSGMPPAAEPPVNVHAVQGLTVFLVLRAFSSGCAALTGVEAISNGIPAFKPPESDNAGKTLIAMAALLITMFLGITFLSHQYGIAPDEATHETIVSMLARRVFGSDTPPYFLAQFATALILLLAANTSFADFPRLASILARDRYLPRQFYNLGDKLVYSNGIIMLGFVSALLVVAFGGSTTRLIPLYALGVFLSFTLSQSGMVVRWWRKRGAHWQIKAIINGVGAVATGIVLAVIALTKFVYGAWAVVILIPIFVLGFRAVYRHYQSVAVQLSLDTYGAPPRVRRHRVIVPVSGVHRGVLRALEYARSVSDDVTAVHVEVDPQETAKIQARWERWGDGVRLKVLPSPYRSTIGPLIEYVNQIDDIRRHDEIVTIVLPQFLPARFWHNFLHNQTAMMIRLAFLFRHDTIVTDVPYRLRE